VSALACGSGPGKRIILLLNKMGELQLARIGMRYCITRGSLLDRT
jgi:hypothetical protein